MGRDVAMIASCGIASAWFNGRRPFPRSAAGRSGRQAPGWRPGGRGRARDPPLPHADRAVLAARSR